MQRRAFLQLCSVSALAPYFDESLFRLPEVPARTGSDIIQSGPPRLAYGRDGRGFLLDKRAGRVSVFDRGSAATYELALPEHAYPVAATSSLDGTMAVVDVAHRSVELYTASGAHYHTIKSLIGPRDVVFLDDGTLLVADALGHQIHGFSTSGRTRLAFGHTGKARAGLNGPTGLALGPQGTIYVADRGHARILTFQLDGTVVAELGHRGRNLGQFISPSALATDLKGRLYIVDRMRADVQIVDSGAVVNRLTFDSSPVAVTMTPDGSPYVSLSALPNRPKAISRV